MIRYLSPCVSICSMDDTDTYCVGCNRTREEIGSWLNYSEERRENLIEELKTRTYDEEGNIRSKGSQAT